MEAIASNITTMLAAVTIAQQKCLMNYETILHITFSNN